MQGPVLWVGGWVCRLLRQLFKKLRRCLLLLNRRSVLVPEFVKSPTTIVPFHPRMAKLNQVSIFNVHSPYLHRMQRSKTPAWEPLNYWYQRIHANVCACFWSTVHLHSDFGFPKSAQRAEQHASHHSKKPGKAYSDRIPPRASFLPMVSYKTVIDNFINGHETFLMLLVHFHLRLAVQHGLLSGWISRGAGAPCFPVWFLAI